MTRYYTEDEEGYNHVERIPEEDHDYYPCLDEVSCGATCEGACYPPSYGEDSSYP